MAFALWFVTDAYILFCRANLHQIYPEIKGHAFFWVREHRKNFFVYDVAVVMKEESRFRTQIEKCEDLCSTPWDKDHYDGFLAKMNDCRTSINRETYDGSSRWSFVKFVIGLYTHEHLLKNEPHEVDHTILKRHPRLCVRLRNLLRIHHIEWMWMGVYSETSQGRVCVCNCLWELWDLDAVLICERKFVV